LRLLLGAAAVAKRASPAGCQPLSPDLRAVLRARGGVMSELLLDRAGRRRLPASMPGFSAGRPPRKQAPALPRGPTERGGESSPSCARLATTPRSPLARPDRDPWARRATHPGSAHPRRSRSDHRRGALLVRNAERRTGARSAWMHGLGGASPLARATSRASRRSAVLHLGIDNGEIIETVHARRAPMIPVSARSGADRR
jgi:hypothetical protein